MSDRQQNLSRRHVVAGVGTAGALAAAAAVLPVGRQVATGMAAGVAEMSPAASPGAQGYRETAHVLRYYQTTRV